MTTSLGAIVKAALERLGISQSDLSRETGVPIFVISHIVCDRRGAGPVYANKLSAALGIDAALFDTRAVKRKAAEEAQRKTKPTRGGPRRPRVASPATRSAERRVA